MSVSPVSGSMSAAMAGVRGQLKAATIARALGDAGLLDERLAAGFEALERASRSATEAGLAAAKAQLLGTLVDVVA